MTSEPPSSVLVLKPSSFGDIIHTLPAVARLKSVWPAARLSWLVNSEWTPLLEGNPDLESVLPFPRGSFRGWWGWRKFHRWQRQCLRGLRPDLVLDFQGLLRSALIGRLSKPRVFYGMADAREGAGWFYDRSALIPSGVPHAVERYLALTDFALAGEAAAVQASESSPLRFPLPAGDPLDVPVASTLEPSYVVLHPYSRGRGKSLSDSQVEAFCRQLAPRQVVLVGRKAETSGPMPPNSLDLLGRTTLRQLLWVMRRAAFVISVDSGPSHLAAALTIPLVAIHTWSDPRRVGPYRPDAWVWKSGQLLQMRNLETQSPAIFTAPPLELTNGQIEMICALATSPSGFCA